MKILSSVLSRRALALLVPAALTLGGLPASAQQPAGMTAKELAAKLSAQQQDGSSLIRAKIEVKGSAGSSVMQVQIKSRRTAGQTDVVYQVLWPKERKGESILVRSSGETAHFTPPDKMETGGLKQPLLGSDLSCEDTVENFFAWPDQSFGAAEQVGGVACQILESKGGRSSYSKVKSWVDLRRMVVMRVEKYSGNSVSRRIDTTDVATVDGKHLPANLTVQRPGQGSTTEVDGSRIKRGVSYTDADFTAEGIKKLDAPKGGD